MRGMHRLGFTLLALVVYACCLSLGANDAGALRAPGGSAAKTFNQTTALPDLLVSSMSITMKDTSCATRDTTMGTRAYISNRGTAPAGAFVVDINGTRQTVSGLGAGQSTSVFVSGYRYGTQSVATVDVTNIVAESNESNNTIATYVAIPTPPPACPTATRTRTSAPTGPTATRTSTPTSAMSPGCSPVSSTISAPFTFDGAGSFCWQSTSLGSYVNSWSLSRLTINGVDFTNRYATAGQLPPKINGYYYISYAGSFSYSHFEAR